MEQDETYVSFSRPVVGAKVYLSRGPSGLPETFLRVSADRELEIYLGHVTPLIAIDSFIRYMLIERRQDQWSDVIEHIGKIVKLDPDSVPCDVAVAFWAQVDLSREAANRAKAQAKRN